MATIHQDIDRLHVGGLYWFPKYATDNKLVLSYYAKYVWWQWNRVKVTYIHMRQHLNAKNVVFSLMFKITQRVFYKQSKLETNIIKGQH